MLMVATRLCPVCGAGAAAGRPFVGDTIDPAKVDGFSFASGKTPEYMRAQAGLEIGTGTGAFLQRLADAGFATLVGVEPSAAALAAAPAARRSWIREGIFVGADFAPASFDLVCCLMTLEHVRDPGELVDAVLRLLRPGGAFVAVTHDYRSLANRLMGRRSPIIDLEHMQLFSRTSARALLERRGYVDVGGVGLRNAHNAMTWGFKP